MTDNDYLLLRKRAILYARKLVEAPLGLNSLDHVVYQDLITLIADINKKLARTYSEKTKHSSQGQKVSP